jgi:hypothetical protein
VFIDLFVGYINLRAFRNDQWLRYSWAACLNPLPCSCSGQSRDAQGRTQSQLGYTSRSSSLKFAFSSFLLKRSRSRLRLSTVKCANLIAVDGSVHKIRWPLRRPIISVPKSWVQNLHATSAGSATSGANPVSSPEIQGLSRFFCGSGSALDSVPVFIAIECQSCGALLPIGGSESPG